MRLFSEKRAICDAPNMGKNTVGCKAYLGICYQRYIQLDAATSDAPLHFVRHETNETGETFKYARRKLWHGNAHGRPWTENRSKTRQMKYDAP